MGVENLFRTELVMDYLLEKLNILFWEKIYAPENSSVPCWISQFFSKRQK